LRLTVGMSVLYALDLSRALFGFGFFLLVSAFFTGG
jgi:hypothetical protein